MKMISKSRESRRSKFAKLPRSLQRLYKETKCSDCSVVVTRMDFAKILGKFTKVKIQYESSSTPKSKKPNQQSSPNSRLKSNANGMVLIHRNAYNKHPVKELLNKPKQNEVPSSHVKNIQNENSKSKSNSTPRQANNVLKENNRLRKTPSANNKKVTFNTKQIHYGIIFENPKDKTEKTYNQNKYSLKDLLSNISKDILPSDSWSLDYFPKTDEPKDDKVYDRIAAELEDLMYNDKSSSKPQIAEKADEFPSILDILNDNTPVSDTKPNDQSNAEESKTAESNDVESNDVEAMLLGKSNDESKSETVAISMEVDNSDVGSLIADVAQLNPNLEGEKQDLSCVLDTIDNPNSPSILDEALQKGIEEHLPLEPTPKDSIENPVGVPSDVATENNNVNAENNSDKKNFNFPDISTVTHLIFKKSINGNCLKTVTCPKNLKYIVELQGKSVEFLGAPKFISSSEDLQVLLQIVDESNLDSLYVLH